MADEQFATLAKTAAGKDGVGQYASDIKMEMEVKGHTLCGCFRNQGSTKNLFGSVEQGRTMTCITGNLFLKALHGKASPNAGSKMQSMQNDKRYIQCQCEMRLDNFGSFQMDCSTILCYPISSFCCWIYGSIKFSVQRYNRL